ncbi:hypothetical protein [Paenibacillus silvisoli]|uniref:hypothetical protein n=1 Tax=Paenibacillus silvisoli TaxID=3110539 RepID=UPI002804D84E|nr:hypothetical protein [Paenibacillus silvisoli]
MRKLPKSLVFNIRFGSKMTKLSSVLCLLGVCLTIYNSPGHPEGITLSAALAVFGVISLKLADGKIKLIEQGLRATGRFKEWKNSFISYNNQVLVYLCYSYTDKRGKRKEARTLSASTSGLEKVNVFFKDEDCTILEYLPGEPSINQENEIVAGSETWTLLVYAGMIVLAIGVSIVVKMA